MKSNKLRAVERDKPLSDWIAYAANTPFLNLWLSRAVKLLPFADESNQKYGNQFT